MPRLGRRGFLAGTAALGVAGALPERARAETPKRGGHLILGLNGGGSSDSLDPAFFNSDYVNMVAQQLYDTLTTVDERSQVQPSLAESWETRPGATEWLIRLRRGVVFHNGKTLTPADVVYSLNHHRGKDSKSLGKPMVAAISDIKATGANEITITLESGNIELPYLLADWHLCIVPEGAPFNGVGTGAFILESFEPGVRARTKRNANDWNSHRGWMNSVESVSINDPTARITALLSGNVHLINKIPLNGVKALESAQSVQLFRISGGTHATMCMMVDTPPYQNLDLRLALKYAIDRDALVKTVLRGYGRLGNDHPVPEYSPYHAADIPQRSYDPERAKFHHKKSGYGGPVIFTTADGAFSGAVEAAQVFQASAVKTGIDFQINRVSSDSYFHAVWRKVPFFASVFGGRPTVDMAFSMAYHSGSPGNETDWSNAKFDRILVAARVEADMAKRKQMYRDLQLLVRDEGATVIPIFIDMIDAGSRNLRGFVPLPYQQMSGYRAAEKVWFADA